MTATEIRTRLLEMDARSAIRETDRLDGIARRTGLPSDKGRANAHYRDVEAPAVKALAIAGGDACLRPVKAHDRRSTLADDVYPHTLRAAEDEELRDQWGQY